MITAMDEGGTVFLIFLWLVIGGWIGAAIGSGKNRRMEGFLAGALVGPIGWIIAAMLDYPRKCPKCSGGIPDTATVCKNCGCDLVERSPSQSPKEPGEPGKKKCPFCAELIQREAIKCRYCGSDLMKAPAPVAETAAATSPSTADIHFECRNCGQPLVTEADEAGEEFKCPECGKPVVVPSASDQESDLRETIPAPPKTNDPKQVGSEIVFECRKCGQSIAADLGAAGQEFCCPKCGEHLIVPQ